MKNKLAGKKVLFVFSDPGGAKAILAFAFLFKKIIQDHLIVSNRVYGFYDEFDLSVQEYAKHDAAGWIDQFQPEIIITATSYPETLELLFIQEARVREIESMSFIDHWTNMSARFVKNEQQILPDNIYVIDNVAKEKAISDGLPEDRIKVLHNPYYQYLQNWAPPIGRNKMLNRLGLSQTDHYLLFAPEPLMKFGLDKVYGFSELDGLKDLVSIWNKQKMQSRLKLVIKPHPNHEKKIFEEVLFNESIIFSEEQDLNALAYYSEAVIGFFSNSLIESHYLGKKVIRLLSRIVRPEIDPIGHIKEIPGCYDNNCISNQLNNIYDQIH